MTSLLGDKGVDETTSSNIQPKSIIPDISALSKSDRKELLRQLLEYEEEENKSNEDDVLSTNPISNDYDHIINLSANDLPKLSNFIPRYSSKSVISPKHIITISMIYYNYLPSFAN